ncbi:hypothetical protein OESDEN_09620 [Oesophagostomum dentatum]|uniref:Uncharacterized protein n=1 Tax=Oesophagostomum dentatum TaxID=61180 RepID=A0A0B1T304_OESDE|nr:hypothetical protein OESDEN_09620 [Oesophagostomum dentatum]
MSKRTIGVGSVEYSEEKQKLDASCNCRIGRVLSAFDQIAKKNNLEKTRGRVGCNDNVEGNELVLNCAFQYLATQQQQIVQS